MRKNLLTITCVLLLVLLMMPFSVALASDITGALYKLGITISNNGTAVTNEVATANVSTPNYVNGGFCNSTATNMALRSSAGADVAFMPGSNATNPMAMFVPSIGANSYLSYLLYTAQSTGGKYRYFPGATGMAVTDNDTLEPGDNFTITQLGWVDTTAVGDNLTYKEDAFKSFISASGNVTARIASAASDTLQYSSDVEVNTAEVAYTKVKEITLTDDVSGARIKFDLKTSGATSYGKIYKNGVAIGTERSTIDTNYTTYSEDIALSAVAGDNIQVYAKAAGGATAYVRNFRIYFDMPEVTATGIASGEHTVSVNMTSPFLGIAVDTDATLPVSDNLVFNAPMWETEEDADPFTTIDSIGHSCNPDANAIWTANGYSFNGTDGRIDAGSDASLDFTQQISVEAWVYPEGYGEGNFGRIYNNDLGGNLYRLFMPNAARLQWDITFALSGSLDISTNADSVPLNDWTHFIGTYDGATMRSYINGVLQTDTEVVAEAMVALGANTLYIGNSDGEDRAWDGTLAEFRIYNQALSQTEVTRNYNATKSKYTTGDIYVYSSLSSVPDNAENWTFCEPDAIPYMEYTEVSINGTQSGYWQWEYGDNFTDLSGNGNTAFPSFPTGSSDPDISTVITSLMVINEAKAPAVFLEKPTPWVEAGYTPATGNFTTTTTSTFPGAGVIEEIAQLTGTPEQLPLNIIAAFVILACSLSISYFMRRYGTGSILVKSIVIGALMGICISTEIYDFWMILYFGIFAFALGMLSQQRGVS